MKCPSCNKPVHWDNNPYRPFCSERCKLVDLGRWVSEEYRVPGPKVSGDGADEKPEPIEEELDE